LAILWNKSSISSRFRDSGSDTYLGHDLDLSRSRDVIGPVTIRFPGGHFLQVLHCHQVAVSSHFRDNGHQTCGVHDLDLSGSRAVIGYVTIRIPGAISYWLSFGAKFLSPAIFEIMGIKHIGSRSWPFGDHVTSSITWSFESQGAISYWWSFGPKSLSLTVSEIFRSKHHVLIDTMLNRHCACAISRGLYTYVKFKYIFRFLTPTLPIHYATFIELLWRIRGVLSLTSNVKFQIERKISKSKNVRNFDLLEDQGVSEVPIYCKRHNLA